MPLLAEVEALMHRARLSPAGLVTPTDTDAATAAESAAEATPTASG
jgi:hypothetical protein